MAPETRPEYELPGGVVGSDYDLSDVEIVEETEGVGDL